MDKSQDETVHIKNLPPISFPFTLVKRYWLSVLLMVIPVTCLVVWGLSKTKIQYSSIAAVVFDPRGTALDVGTRYPDMAHFGQQFGAAAKNIQYLTMLVERLKLQENNNIVIEKPIHIRILTKILPEDFLPKPWLLEGEEYEKYALAVSLIPQLTPLVSRFDMLFQITAKAGTPQDAMLLARNFMDLFVELQMQEYLAAVSSYSEFLDAKIEEERLRIDNLTGLISIYSKDEPDKPLKLTRAQKKGLVDRERSSITGIVKKQQELARTFDLQVETKLRLESEIANLLTRIRPTHPDVIQKKSELDKVKSSTKATQLRREIDGMMKKLLQLQARMKRAGIPIDMSLQQTALSNEGQGFLGTLIQKSKEYQLEKESIERQLADRSQRVRFRYTSDPVPDPKIANKKAILLKVGIGGGLIFLTIILTVLVKDLRNPFILDLWRLKNKLLGIPVVVFDKKALKSSDLQGVEQMERLKSDVVDPKGDENSSSGIAFQNLRHMHVLSQPLQKNPILLIPLGHKSDGQFLAGSFANVVASNSSESSLLLDMNPVNPATLSKGKKYDVVDFLAGRCKWGEVKSAKDKHMLFDYAKIHDGNLKDLKLTPLKKLFRALNEQYKNIVVHGQPSQLFVENHSLLQVVGQSFLVVTMGSARYKDLDRSLNLLSKDSIRGIIVLDS